MSSSYCVYLLGLVHPTKVATYTGSTNNLERRLRQHNGEISGSGTRYTRMASRNHKYRWEVICIVQGFESRSAACSFEHHVKHKGVASRAIHPARLGQLFSTCRQIGADKLTLQWYAARYRPQHCVSLGSVREITAPPVPQPRARTLSVGIRRKKRRGNVPQLLIVPRKVADVRPRASTSSSSSSVSSSSGSSLSP